ncbi:MAG TPA: hypothetical protein VK555_12295 [Terriglobales bacterium]|nr:hypothetical protein [Terriglobales bacterium]
MKKILLILINTLLLAGALSMPTILKADGDPQPSCPPHQLCKP